MAHIKVDELEVFCATCPSAEEVTSLLQAVGFTLIFYMDAVPSACAGALPLPAQYHYQDKNVMYNPKSTPLILFSSSGLRVTASTTVSALCLAPPSLRI
jgi:hypothetical protein